MWSRPALVSLRRGFGWNTSSQFVTGVTSLVLLPFVIGRLGLAAYGALTLANAAAGWLQQIDGGMLNAATRYFGIAAGAGDRRALGRYFLTISLLVVLISSPLAAGLFLLAPHVLGLFTITPRLHHATLFALRVAAVLLPIGLFQGVVGALLTAYGRFGALAFVGITSRLAYVAGVFALLNQRGGIETIMRLTFAQQTLSLLLVLVIALPLADIRHAALLPWRSIREIIAYSVRVQVFSAAAMVNFQVDALVIGAVLPVEFVGLYGAGSNVVGQLRSLPLNVAGPLIARLTQTLGRDGAAASFREYVRLQTLWAVAVSGFCAVAMGTSLFAIEAWLGPHFTAAGLVCVILLAGNLINLPTMPLTVYLQAIGRPEVEVRYGLASAGVNLVLTAGLVWVGLYGVVGATALGTALGSLWLLPIARSRVSREIPSFLAPIPWRATVAAAAVAAGAAALLHAGVPLRGATGLVVVGIGALPGVGTFAAVLLGPAHAVRLISAAARGRTLAPLVSAISVTIV